MQLQKKDFIEIEFTGKTKEGEIFDTNIASDLKKANLNIEAKPFIFSLGEGMFLKGIEDFLVGKETGKKYDIELEAKDAFGTRDSKMVKIMPMKLFHGQKIQPVQGAMFNFDGRIAKILSVSGGRVIVDFNNPMAGKTVIYNINVIKKIEDPSEKIKALNEFLFKRDLKFELKDNKLIIEVEKEMKPVIEMFKNKYKEILGLELEVEELEGKKE